jgi:cell division protein FtsB
MSKYGFMKRPTERTSTKRYVADAQKNFVRGVLLLIITTLLIIFIFGDHGVLQLYKLKKERSEVQSYIAQLRKDREILLSDKNKLENDLKYIEKLARERYRMAKPGEKVFKVVPKNENDKK